VAGGQILAFPIDIDRRPYNTLALPCECVIEVSLIPLVYKHVCDPLFTCAIPERLRDELLIIKRYTNETYFTFYILKSVIWRERRELKFCIAE